MPLAEAVDGELDRHADRKLGNVDRRNHRLHLEIAEVDDRDERRLDRDLLARLHVALGDDAAQRRDDIGVVQRIPRELDLRLRRLQVAARDAVRRLGAVERVLRDELVVAEGARSSCASSRRARAARGRFRPRRRDRRAGTRGRAMSMCASFCPARTGSPSRTVELDDVAGDLRLDDRLVHRLQRPGDRAASVPAACSRRTPGRPATNSQRDGRRALGRRLRGRALARAQRDRAREAADERHDDQRDR